MFHLHLSSLTGWSPFHSKIILSGLISGFGNLIVAKSFSRDFHGVSWLGILIYYSISTWGFYSVPRGSKICNHFDWIDWSTSKALTEISEKFQPTKSNSFQHKSRKSIEIKQNYYRIPYSNFPVFHRFWRFISFFGMSNKIRKQTQ